MLAWSPSTSTYLPSTAWFERNRYEKPLLAVRGSLFQTACHKGQKLAYLVAGHVELLDHFLDRHALQSGWALKSGELRAILSDRTAAGAVTQALAPLVPAHSRDHKMRGDDRFNLQRFVDAQDPVYEVVCSELRAGRKRSHWMWFIFPQLSGLGHSEVAKRFAISSREEAAAYVEHPLLGVRLRECTQLVNLVEGASAETIFGYPDFLKFRSCMTLFASAVGDNVVFRDALDKYFAGRNDQRTLELLG